MLSEISIQLSQVIEKRRRKEKIQANLAQVNEYLEEKNKLLEALKKQLEKEQVDVERLEKLSLTGLFYTVLGSREQQADKERQELLAAQLKFQQARQSINALRADQESLKSQLNDLQGVEGEYAWLVERKKTILSQANPQVATELTRLAEQIANRNAEIREIDEALAAAKGALASLDQVVGSLESAEEWGYWDILGGDFLSTAIKHSHVDDARDAMQDAQARISRFNRELADVKRSMNASIEIGNLETFADYFLDGLIVDWVVQSKIQDSLEQSRQARKSIAGAVENLRRLRNATLDQIRDLNNRRTLLVEQS